MVENCSGGILALIETLGDHWGAVQRDLLTDGLRYGDMGDDEGRELEFAALASYVAFAPPLTAIHFARSGGWLLGDRLAAALLEEQRLLVWMKTEDATKPVELQEYRPEPIMWPGRVVPKRPEPEDDGKMTVDEYLKIVGYIADWGDGT